MPYSITNIKNDVEGALHGTTINKVRNFYGLCNRTARDVLDLIDPQETKRSVLTASPIFNRVWDYPLPADVKGNKIIDIRPQVDRYPGDILTQQYSQDFDQGKDFAYGIGNSAFNIKFNSSLKSIRINSNWLPQGITLNSATILDGDGIWSVGGGATNLRVDNQNYLNYQGSLAFDLLGGQTTGYIQVVGMDGKDLSAQVNQATEFLYSYFPTASGITSVTLDWGSSIGDYYSVTTTQTQQATAFQNAWNLLAFGWSGATVTGTPLSSNITYIRVTFTYNSTAQTGLHIGSIQSTMGRYMEMEFYSKFLFRNASTGVYQETVLLDSDLINLDTDSYNIFFNRLMVLICQQVQGADATYADGPFFMNEFEKGIVSYRSKYKSEVQKPQSTYWYRRARTGYSGYGGFFRTR